MLKKLVDVSKLVRVKNYAKDKEVSCQTVYNHLQNGDLKGEQIDGYWFVYKKQPKLQAA